VVLHLVVPTLTLPWNRRVHSHQYASAAAHCGDKDAYGNDANGDSGEEGEGEGHAEENAENSSNGEDSDAKKTVYFRRHGKPLLAQRKYMEQIYCMTLTKYTASIDVRSIVTVFCLTQYNLAFIIMIWGSSMKPKS